MHGTLFTDTSIQGRYEIVRKLGEGGMGVVYLARQISLDRLVAIKALREDRNSDQLLKRFRREAKIVQTLVHPNIVRLLDHSLGPPTPYLVFEYVEGDLTLEKVLARSGLSLGDALVLGLEICSGVAFIHANGIIHRDLKPANVLIDPQGHAKLIDLGLSRATDSELTRLTLDGQLLGTPSYMAPEQVCGEPVTFRSDVCSLGLVLYEIVAGARVFGCQGDPEKIIRPTRRLSEDLPSIRGLRPGIPRALDNLLQRCAARAPEKRPADGCQVFEELTAIMESALAARSPRTVEIKLDLDQRLASTGSCRSARTEKVDQPVSDGEDRNAKAAAAWGRLHRRYGPVVAAIGLLMVVSIILAAGRPRESTRPVLLSMAAASCREENPRQPCAERLKTHLAGLVGETTDDLARFLSTCRACLRQCGNSSSRLGCLDRVIPAGARGELVLLLSEAGLLTHETANGRPHDRALFTQIARLGLFDELVESLGEAPPFRAVSERALGPYGPQREFPDLSGHRVFGYRAPTSMKEGDSGRWEIRLPKVPDSDPDLVLVFNELDPKMVVEVVVNNSLTLFFRNRSGVVGGCEYSIPSFFDVGTARRGKMHYTPSGPMPDFVALGRCIPRSAVHAGKNTLMFRFLHLPGPLRLPHGRVWKTPADLSSGSLWHAYLSFPASSGTGPGGEPR